MANRVEVQRAYQPNKRTCDERNTGEVMSSSKIVRMPAPDRRVLLLGEAVLGAQCIIALSMSVVGMAIAAARMLGGDYPQDWRAILIGGGKTYAEAVSVLSLFFVTLTVIVIECSLRRGEETRDPVAFWRGVSAVATVSLAIASINVIVYVGLAFCDINGASWRGSAIALVYLGLSVLAFLAAVRARYAASEAVTSAQ